MKTYGSLFLLILLVVSGSAQTHDHQNTTSTTGPMIDGEIHPEQIPDVSAYRLVFSALAVAPNASDRDREVQKAKLEPLHLSYADVKVLIQALDTFYVKFQALIDAHNREAKLAAAQLRVIDESDFLSKRDAMVEEIGALLTVQMSPAGLKLLHDYVQGEKKHIKLSVVTR